MLEILKLGISNQS